MPAGFDGFKISAALCIAAGISLHSASALAQDADTVSVGIPENMPFAGIIEGRARGLVARVTLLALKRMNLNATFRSVPYSRLYKWIGEGKLDVAVSVFKSSERAKLAIYSKPMAREYTIVVVPKGRTFPFSRAEDLMGRRIGAQLGFIYPGIDHLDLPLVRERSYKASLPMVIDGRLAGTLVGSVTGLYDAKKLGLSARVETLSKSTEVIELSTAFSKKRFSVQDVAIFDQYVQFMRAGPFWNRVTEESGAAEFIRDWPMIDR